MALSQNDEEGNNNPQWRSHKFGLGVQLDPLATKPY